MRQVESTHHNDDDGGETMPVTIEKYLKRRKTPTITEIKEMEKRRYLGTPPHEKILNEYRHKFKGKEKERELIAVHLKKIYDNENIPTIS
jgi:hypothetical protein